MKIYEVEERFVNAGDGDWLERASLCHAIYCSTEEKAREYCKTYPLQKWDLQSGWFWLVIREYILDDEDYQIVVAFYDNKGNEIENQPINGYN